MCNSLRASSRGWWMGEGKSESLQRRLRNLIPVPAAAPRCLSCQFLANLRKLETSLYLKFAIKLPIKRDKTSIVQLVKI